MRLDEFPCYRLIDWQEAERLGILFPNRPNCCVDFCAGALVDVPLPSEWKTRVKDGPERPGVCGVSVLVVLFSERAAAAIDRSGIEEGIPHGHLYTQQLGSFAWLMVHGLRGPGCEPVTDFFIPPSSSDPLTCSLFQWTDSLSLFPFYSTLFSFFFPFFFYRP